MEVSTQYSSSIGTSITTPKQFRSLFACRPRAGLASESRPTDKGQTPTWSFDGYITDDGKLKYYVSCALCISYNIYLGMVSLQDRFARTRRPPAIDE